MKDYLLFTLFGPMASWGDMAVGETRPSHAYPTKSSVIGLCAAALGIERSQENLLSDLNASLSFAVCIEREGEFMMDYHTTQVPSVTSLKKRPHRTRRDELAVKEELKTILSSRDYYCDARYTVILWYKHTIGQYRLEDIRQALNKPRFTLYLGRKSCPLALPVMPQIIAASALDQVIQQYLADSVRVDIVNHFLTDKQRKNLGNDKNLRVYADIDAEFSQKDESVLQVRKDQLLNRQAWQYGDRQERLYFLTLKEGDA